MELRCVAVDAKAVERAAIEGSMLYPREWETLLGQPSCAATVSPPTPIFLAQAVAVIVIPPRAFCLSVTVTSLVSSSSAAAMSSRIRTANASQKAPSFR